MWKFWSVLDGYLRIIVVKFHLDILRVLVIAVTSNFSIQVVVNVTWSWSGKDIPNAQALSTFVPSTLNLSKNTKCLENKQKFKKLRNFENNY